MVLDHNQIQEALKEEENRKYFDDKDVRVMMEKRFLEMEQLIDELYDLCCLEAKKHCDGFHNAKSDFRRLGQDFGFISAFVRQHKGSNEFTFKRRYLGEKKEGETRGPVYRHPIKKIGGKYTRSALSPWSSHQDELNLALMTEEHFQRLREMGSFLKAQKRAFKRVESRKMIPKTEQPK